MQQKDTVHNGRHMYAMTPRLVPRAGVSTPIIWLYCLLLPCPLDSLTPLSLLHMLEIIAKMIFSCVERSSRGGSRGGGYLALVLCYHMPDGDL